MATKKKTTAKSQAPAKTGRGPTSDTQTQGSTEIARLEPPRLPWHPAIEERFQVTKAEWMTLVEAIFPTAQTTQGVILALSYCRARGLDPFKHPVHVVSIWDKSRQRMVESVWPGIGELRTTAMRTGVYAGRDDTRWGETDEADFLDSNNNPISIEFPEWAQVTVYRIVSGARVPFVGPKVRWRETYQTEGRNSEAPNAMWQKRPFGQLEKCAEAAALRAAFPEEIGADYIGEEAPTQRVVSEVREPSAADERSGQLAERISGRHREEEAAAPEPEPEPESTQPEEPVEPQGQAEFEQQAPDESDDTPPDEGISPLDAAIDLYVQTYGATPQAAQDHLERFADRIHDKPFGKLDPHEINAIMTGIRVGHIAPLKGQ